MRARSIMHAIIKDEESSIAPLCSLTTKARPIVTMPAEAHRSSPRITAHSGGLFDSGSPRVPPINVTPVKDKKIKGTPPIVTMPAEAHRCSPRITAHSGGLFDSGSPHVPPISVTLVKDKEIKEAQPIATISAEAHRSSPRITAHSRGLTPAAGASRLGKSIAADYPFISTPN
jgi:hypothetical protein